MIELAESVGFAIEPVADDPALRKMTRRL